jgi:dephospho-CoA kinase
MSNLIGISGKIKSGKDTIGEMIRYLHFTKMGTDHRQYDNVQQWLNAPNLYSKNFTIKKYADKLKDITCILLGCTREQLEDREFKESVLGEEWWYYYNTDHHGRKTTLYPYAEATKCLHRNWYNNNRLFAKPTVRSWMQTLGTDCGRNMIHPNMWVNALFADYKSAGEKIGFKSYSDRDIKEGFDKKPNWIITDVRFENEVKAIKDRGGICIRVNRPIARITKLKDHKSESALDSYQDWDYTINNNGTLEELLEEVKKMCKHFKIIE